MVAGTTADKAASEYTVTGLSSDTTYYFVMETFTPAIPTGWPYTHDLTSPFSIEVSAGTPTLSTTTASGISSMSSGVGGDITDNGGATVTERGICWSTGHNPSLNDASVTSGIGTGTSSAVLTNLTPNTRYYARAHAINTFGTAYGNEIFFKTQLSFPIVTTAPIIAVTDTAALSGGSVQYAENGIILGRGVCWATSSYLSTALHPHTNDGAALGDFISQINGLNPNTTYFARAYVSVQIGVATYTIYGYLSSFTTLKFPVVKRDISGVDSTTPIGLDDAIFILREVAGLNATVEGAFSQNAAGVAKNSAVTDTEVFTMDLDSQI